MSFELLEPATLDEALTLLDPDDPAVRAVAGGTALSLMVQSHIFKPTRLISLRRLNGDLRGVHVEGDGSLRIGAMTTLTELERSPVLAVSEPVLSRALHTLSNVRVRNIATVGGHLAHGDPHQDLPPILLTLGARVVDNDMAIQIVREFLAAQFAGGRHQRRLDKITEMDRQRVADQG